MHKLVLFSKHLNVASDDFVFSGSFEVLLRSIGLLIVIAEFVRYHHDFECSSGHLVHNYLTGVMIFFTLTVIVDCLIVRVSMRGTIINDTPRQNISTYLYIRLIILIVELLWTVYGTASIVLHMPVCESDPRLYWLACATVVGGWTTTVVQGILFITAFDFNSPEHSVIITKHDWEKRWKGLCCCLNVDENKHVFSTLSRLCMQIFKKEEELVPSDILAGLILVYRKQHVTRQQLDVVDSPHFTGRLRFKPYKTAESPSIPRKMWMTFHDAAHFMKFALGSYGWFYYIGLNNPVVASCRLLQKLNWSMKEPPPHIEKENKFWTNIAAFCIQTGCSVDDIVWASFNNLIYEIPFYVCIDNESQSVIVAVRGTLSLEDILTDLVVERAPVCYNGVIGLVHTGMYQSAKYIRNRLLLDDILGKAFHKAPDYRLVITGHSLGGGVAALLALELKSHYPDLICFAFATPGELVSESLLPYAEEFICTVALGYDVVPRLGLLEAIQFRIDVLNAIRNCSLPKIDFHTYSEQQRSPPDHMDVVAGCSRVLTPIYMVIAGRTWTKLFGKTDLDHLPDDNAKIEDAEWFDMYIQEEIREKRRILANFEPLYPPGQILHILEKKDDKRPRNVDPEYYAEWTDCKRFREIILSSRMIAHHFPDTLLDALRQLTEHYRGDEKKDD